MGDNQAIMKILVAATALIALTSAQHPTEPPHNGNCHCGVFISTEDAELEIHHMHADADIEACIASCTEEWINDFGNGDLNAELENGEILGQELCHGAQGAHHPNVEHAIPMVYARMCDGGWTPTGDQASDYLCCDGGHFHPCPTGPPPPM